MIEQLLSQQQKLRQEQIMAPQQLQSLQFLTTTLAEMEQKINQELQDNPTLEVVDHGIDRLAGNPLEEYQAGEPTDFTARDDNGEETAAAKNQMLEKLLRLAEANRSFSAGSTVAGYDQESEERRRHFWDSLVSEQTLTELLEEQLAQTDGLDPESVKVCQEIIGSIDHSGYLRSHPADIATTCQCPIETVEHCLQVVQQFDPPGVAARDLRECLSLQLERQGRRSSLAWKIVQHHLDDLGRNRLQQIARSLNVNPGELKPAIEEIRRLRPYPGSHIAPEDPTEFVVPEVVVEIDRDGEPQVTSNHDYVPRLRIAPYYLKLLEDPETPRETKNYIREKLTSSRQLLKMVEQREATIVRIARSLVALQRDFFTKGIDHLAPLTMAQVAEDIGVHETTVSRAVANKYMMTPHGMLSFRSFFTAGYRKQNGEEVSTSLIKQKIQELVSREDRRQPWSDQQIVGQLQKDGFHLARRTVAKYREELGIRASNLRRSF